MAVEMTNGAPDIDNGAIEEVQDKAAPDASIEALQKDMNEAIGGALPEKVVDTDKHFEKLTQENQELRSTIGDLGSKLDQLVSSQNKPEPKQKKPNLPDLSEIESIFENKDPEDTSTVQDSLSIAKQMKAYIDSKFDEVNTQYVQTELSQAEHHSALMNSGIWDDIKGNYVAEGSFTTLEQEHENLMKAKNWKALDEFGKRHYQPPKAEEPHPMGGGAGGGGSANAKEKIDQMYKDLELIEDPVKADEMRQGLDKLAKRYNQ